MYKYEENSVAIIEPSQIIGINSEDVVLEEFEDIKKLGEDMIKYCAEKGALGLAAAQIGVFKNFFVFMNGENSYQLILNPTLFPGKKKTNVVESCLSYPDEQYIITRSKEVRVKFFFVKDGKMMSHSKAFRNERAFILQHEYDHLIGVSLATKGAKF